MFIKVLNTKPRECIPAFSQTILAVFDKTLANTAIIRLAYVYDSKIFVEGINASLLPHITRCLIACLKSKDLPLPTFDASSTPELAICLY